MDRPTSLLWKSIFLVLGVLFYAQDAAGGWNRGAVLGPVARAFIILAGMPGLALVFVDMRSDRTWLFRPPTPYRPSDLVPKHPLGLGPGV